MAEVNSLRIFGCLGSYMCSIGLGEFSKARTARDTGELPVTLSAFPSVNTNWLVEAGSIIGLRCLSTNCSQIIT